MLVCLVVPVEGGQQPVDSQAPPAITDRPPPPLPPAVIGARDAAGRVTVRAVRIADPLRIDGRLDEAVYAREQTMSDFLQNVLVLTGRRCARQ